MNKAQEIIEALRDECEFDTPTNLDIIASNPETLAAWIIQAQKSDPSVLWCKDSKGCADLGEDFICTDEMQAACIVEWINSPAEIGGEAAK